jgi:formamidopyrimidine-DNA glycosylase
MPELPEAETIARRLHALLHGKRLGPVEYIRPDIIMHGPPEIPAWLENARVQRVDRRGKRPIVHLPEGRGIIFFLGMTGKVTVQSPGREPAPHTHMRIGLADSDRELRFTDPRRFGGVSFFETANGETPAGLADLGVEPLDMTVAEFREIASRGRQIKALLMDQSAVAGLGNIYCDEALHRAGIHPLTIAARIDVKKVDRLRLAIRRVLKESIEFKGTTVSDYAHPDGPGAFQRRLRVYQHPGRPCRKCKTPIIAIAAAGRTTHLCPTCQPAPRRRRSGG